MTREEKILALTKYELEFIVEHQRIDLYTTKFFAKGGFNSYTNEELDLAMYHKFGDD